MSESHKASIGVNIPLNPDQEEAVYHPGGPLLVVAGAGSGKTRVLTQRIAWLISQGIHPMEILAITFTNKAAEEMRHRVADLVGPVARNMWVTTFHKSCVRMLRQHAELIDYPKQFTIYDSQDSKRLIGYVIRDMGLDPKKFPAGASQSRISLWKNELVFPAKAFDTAEHVAARRHAEIYREYQARLVRAGAMDFDDLLVNVVRLFESHPSVLQQYQQRFKHILIDEYQDTNQAQNRIVLLLGQQHKNVCVVGDSDQSIYKFRGADMRNIDQFENAFGETTVVVLAQNYRSTQTILTAANAVISQNIGRRPKDLWTSAGDGERIVRYFAEDEYDESSWVASTAQELQKKEKRAWGDIAVMYRTNAQSRAIEESMMRAGIPYKVVGGTKFYERREVKDAIAYLKAGANPLDEISIKRVLNVPKRGIGDMSIGKIDAFAAVNSVSFVEAMRRADELLATAKIAGDEANVARSELGQAITMLERDRSAEIEARAAADRERTVAIEAERSARRERDAVEEANARLYKEIDAIREADAQAETASAQAREATALSHEKQRQASEAQARVEKLLAESQLAQAEATRLEQEVERVERDLDRRRAMAQEQASRLRERGEACERLRQAVDAAEKTLKMELEAMSLDEQAAREGTAATETLERLGKTLAEAQSAAAHIQQQRRAVQVEHELLGDQEAIALRRQSELDQELTERVESARKREQEARQRANQLRTELQGISQAAVEPKLN